MTPDQFFALEEAEAATLGEALFALWWEARGDWDRAHVLAQQAGESDDRAQARGGCRVHAYLHRLEGDEGNAGYWYGRAGRGAPVRGTSFAEERNAIALELLARREQTPQ